VAVVTPCQVDNRLESQLEYSRDANFHGVNFTDLEMTGQEIRAVAADWTRAMQMIRNTTQNYGIVTKKFVFNFALVSLREHLVKIQQACVGNQECLEIVRAEMVEIDQLLPLTLRWIPRGASLTGLIVAILLFLSGTCIIFFAALGPREWTYLILATGITVTAGLRICFWTMGWRGFGDQTFFSEVAFFVVDKVASVIFTLTLLFFLHMWLKAVHAEIYPLKKAHLRAISIGFLAMSVGLIVTSITLSVIYSQSHTIYEIDNYHTLDLVDLILATLLFVVGCVLLTYILLTFSFLIRGATSLKKQMLSIYIIFSFTVALLTVFLVRLVLVYMGAGLFYEKFFVGFAIYYGIGTLAVETVGSVLIFLVVFMRTYASVRSETTTHQSLQTPLLDEIPEMYADI